MFRGLKIYLNVFAVRSLPWAPLTEFAALPQAISWIYLFIWNHKRPESATTCRESKG